MSTMQPVKNLKEAKYSFDHVRNAWFCGKKPVEEEEVLIHLIRFAKSQNIQNAGEYAAAAPVTEVKIMKMKTRLLGAVMSILIMTSLFCPVVNAEPAPVIAAGTAAPEIAEVVIAGITVVMSGIAALKIAENLGVTWDRAADSWDTFVKSVSTGLDNLLHAKRWIDVSSSNGTALMTAMAAAYDPLSAGGSGGKKDNKWYFEYRKNYNKVEINPERMNEEQAVKEMGRGKNIMTVHKELARKLVGRYEGTPPHKVEFETSRVTRDISYEHAHYYAHGQRLHCSIWRP